MYSNRNIFHALCVKEKCSRKFHIYYVQNVINIVLLVIVFIQTHLSSESYIQNVDTLKTVFMALSVT